MKLDIEKFSFGQLTSNSDGKTSGSGTEGLLISTIGAICFLYATIFSHPELIANILLFTGMGVGLLGYRKSLDIRNNLKNENTEIDNTIQK